MAFSAAGVESEPLYVGKDHGSASEALGGGPKPDVAGISQGSRGAGGPTCRLSEKDAPAAAQRQRVVRFSSPLAETRMYVVPDEAALTVKTVMTTVEEVLQLLQSDYRPSELIAMEYSGALLEARIAQGSKAISCDQRRPEHDHFHYLGDLRDIIGLQVWEAVFFVGPNCYQHLRGDLDCLQYKIADGRAFWAGIMVLWCICCSTALMMLVEQPDTIGHDYFQFETQHEVAVMETRSGQYGDEPDKFLRLTTRNMQLEPPPHPNAAIVRDRGRSQFKYRDADERDRARSSWRPFTHLVASLARARPVKLAMPPAMDYLHEAEKFAVAWYRSGKPVPADYLNPDALPSSAADRAYQLVRGQGTRTRMAGVVPMSLRRESREQEEMLTASDGEPPRLERCSEAAPEGQAALPPMLDDGSRRHEQHGGEPQPSSHAELLEKRKERFSRPVDGDAALRAVHEAKRQFGRLATSMPAAEAGAALSRMAADDGQPLLEDEALLSHTESRGVAGASDDDLTLAPLSLDDEDSTAVVMVSHAGDEPLVYVPVDGQQLHFLSSSKTHAKGVVAAAEGAARRLLSATARLFGYRAGTAEGRRKLVVVATDEKPPPATVARDTEKRRDAMKRGALAIWCTLAALGPSVVANTANLAVLSATQFMTHDHRTTAMLQAEQVAREATGLAAGVTGLMAPWSPSLVDGDAVTARGLVQRSNEGLELLRDQLRHAEGPMAGYLAEWADAIKPLPLAEVPEDLLDRRIHLGDPSLDEKLFSEPLPVYETPWLDRMPRQRWVLRPGCDNFEPRSVLDLVDPDARLAISGWMRGAAADLKDLELNGEKSTRSHKPPDVAIGQDQFHYCARGYVWDCRSAGAPPLPTCELLDYGAEFDTDFNLAYLRQKLEGYPDQRLASNVLEGVRLEADVELQMYLAANSQTIAEGYHSVQKTVRELRAMGFYDFFTHLPFGPMIIVSQGSREKRMTVPGVRKYRRTSNFSGPHRLIKDKSGVPVVPINTAARCYVVPKWMSSIDSDEMRSWLSDRYEHVPRDEQGGHSTASPRYKFPKEEKPLLEDVMVDATLLGAAGIELGEPLLAMVEDAGFYFNQFGYAPEELWRSNLVVGAQDGDVATASDRREHDPGEAGSSAPVQMRFKLHQPVIVSEKRLGFGSYPSSNIAQRFSNAVVGWTLEEFDKLEEEAYERMKVADNARWQRWSAWRLRRQRLEERCRRERPKQRRKAASDCTQHRLATLKMYTDDPVAIVCGAERMLRLIIAWRTVTSAINLQMAGPEKRQLGAGVEWVGILILVGIGLVVVPKNKLTRAREAIVRCIRGELTFADYRKMVGLLEHLKVIARVTADLTNALYRPHRKDGESSGGPATFVKPDGLMLDKLQEWLAVIMSCGGALVTMVFAGSALERFRAATRIFAGTADAAGDGEGEPGFGGFLHGFYWRVALTSKMLSLMHITAWETLANTVNIFVADRLAGPDALLSQRGDAAITPYAVSNRKSKSRDVQVILHKLEREPDYTTSIAPRLVIEHLAGDYNGPSDRTSRALWSDLLEMCHVLNVKPIMVELNEREKRFIMDVIQTVAESRGAEVSVTEMAEMMQASGPPGAPTLWFKRRHSASDASSTSTHGGRRSRAWSRSPSPEQPSSPPPRSRMLSAVEQSRGKRQRGNTDGDGPRGVPRCPCEHGCKAPSTRRVIGKRPCGRCSSFFNGPFGGRCRRLGCCQRNRPLTEVERGCGSARRDNDEGDGPGFRPSWASAVAACIETVTAKSSSSRFRPSWSRAAGDVVVAALERKAAAKADSTRSPMQGLSEERNQSNPYLRPAYRDRQLREDQRRSVDEFVERLVHDRTEGRIDAPAKDLRELAYSVAEARFDGINPRSASKDAFALREFECFAALRGFDPNLQTRWTRRFPQRESLKLAGYLLFRSQRAKGRAKGQPFAKPMSVYQNYLALRRVFKGREVELPPSTAVRETLKGLVKRYIRGHGAAGIEMLRPKRVEPITPAIVRKCRALADKGGTKVKGVVWSIANWVCFIVTVWMVVNLQVGSRKGESTKLQGDVDANDWFTRSSLTWRINGLVLLDPTPQQLNSMQRGRDIARLAPKGAKCDAFGTCHGTEPIILPFDDTSDLNPAAMLREVELRWPCHGQDREELPLFCDGDGQPFTDSRFAALINGTLDAVLGAERAKLYSPHSWRVWLASALRMCNASDGLIMAFGRWLNPESVKIYARLTTDEYAKWMDKIMHVSHIDAARTTSLPPMDIADMMEEWQRELATTTPRATARKRRRDDADADEFDTRAADVTTEPVVLKAGDRISVFWTEMDEWYAGSVTSSRTSTGDDGRPQRMTRVLYDAVEPWPPLPYWHCLDDETWKYLES